MKFLLVRCFQVPGDLYESVKTHCKRKFVLIQNVKTFVLIQIDANS